MEFKVNTSNQCVDVNLPNCTDEWKTVFNKACKTTYTFDCNTNKSQVVNSTKRLRRDLRGLDLIKVDEPTFAIRNDQIGNNVNKYIKLNENHNNEKKCRKTPQEICKNIPREVKAQNCQQHTVKTCANISMTYPHPVEKQRCHDENKTVCKLYEKFEPKRIKKFVYKTNCKPIAKKVCENVETKYLQPKCESVIRPNCTWIPLAPECKNIPKEHCYDQPYLVKIMECSEGSSDVEMLQKVK